MKSFGKILLGILIVLLLFCLGGGAFLWYSHRGRQVRKLVHNTVQMKKSAERLARLQTKDAFVPPENGVISEERLKLYIGICKDIDPSVESYLKWIDSHQGRQGSLQDAVDGVKKTDDLFHLLVGELEKSGMGPAEFVWTGQTIRRTLGSGGQRDLRREERLLRALEKCSRYPELTEAHRRSIDSQIVNFRKEFGMEATPAASSNIALLNRYAADLEKYNLDEKSFQIVKGFMNRRGPRRGIFIDEKPDGVKAGGKVKK